MGSAMSSSKLVPDDPAKVMVIRDVVPNTLVTLSTPFWRFGQIKIGGRGTIVRLRNGSLAVFSPVALTDDVKAKLASLGNNVQYITALDIEHHMFLGPWASAFPSAKILGPEGLPEKRAKQKDVENIPFTHIFKSSIPHGLASIDPAFDAEFSWEFIPAHPNKEIVFHHRPTSTLIEADLLFNYPATEQFSRTGVSATSGVLTRIFGALTSVEGKAQKRMAWYAFSAGDRMGFAKSVERIEEWGFERIVPCHGDVVEGRGKEVFRHVFGWHLELARKGV